MPNTTNYSFPTPADTDLVKNGADAIRDLGDAVDTAMNTALGTKKAGMVLLNTTSFSAVSSVSLPAATFSATYDNYLVIMNVDSSASSETLNVRMRTGGSDNSSANYAYGNYGIKGQTTSASFYASGNALKTSIVVPAISGTYTTSLSFNFLKPFDSSFNTNLFFENSYFDSIANYEFHTGQGVLSVTTSYDAASFIIASGTITGVYSVYGYSK